MKAVYLLAMKEFRDGLRNRWIVASILLLIALSLSLHFLGSAPGGSIKASVLDVTVVSLASLSVYLLPLIALMLSYDALVGEFERGTLLLLLTYPVSRWQVILGKFTGHMLMLLFAIFVGYGFTAGWIALTSEDVNGNGWLAYLSMMLSSWLLGGIFLGLGYVISVLVRERATAAGLAVAIWLVLVVIYDLLLLGGLLLDSEHLISEQLFSILMLINPTDAYRILNLMLFDGVSQAAGLAGIGQQAGFGVFALLSSMLAWIVVPLLFAISWFHRREL